MPAGFCQRRWTASKSPKPSPKVLRFLEAKAGRHAKGPGSAGIADDQTSIAGGGNKLLEIVLIESIAHPGRDGEAIIRPETSAEIVQGIAFHIHIDRARGIRREFRTVAGVVTEE